MSGGTSETKLVNFAMGNKTRRKIINFLANGHRNVEEIEALVGNNTIDFHLKILQDADPIELTERTAKISEYGKNFWISNKKAALKKLKIFLRQSVWRLWKFDSFCLYSGFHKFQSRCKYGSSTWWSLKNS